MNGNLLSRRPQLNTQGIDIAGPLVAGTQMREQREQQAFRNRLLEQQEGRAQTGEARAAEQFQLSKEDRLLQKQAQALSLALQAQNPKQAMQIYKKFGGSDVVDFAMVGPAVEFTLSDGTTVKGPGAVVQDLLEAASKDPKWLQDPLSLAYAMGKGVSITAPSVKEQLSIRKILKELQEPGFEEKERMRQRGQKDLAQFKSDLPAKPKAPTPEKPGVAKRRKVATQKDVAAAETKILANPDNPAIAGQINTFNMFSTAPYMYVQVQEPGRFFGKNLKLKTIKLPKDPQGKQVTAAEVWEAHEETGLPVEEVLRLIGAPQPE